MKRIVEIDDHGIITFPDDTTAFYVGYESKPLPELPDDVANDRVVRLASLGMSADDLVKMRACGLI